MFCHQRQVGTGAPDAGRADGDQCLLTGSGCVIGEKGGALVANGVQLAPSTGSVSDNAISASAAAITAVVVRFVIVLGVIRGGPGSGWECGAGSRVECADRNPDDDVDRFDTNGLGHRFDSVRFDSPANDGQAMAMALAATTGPRGHRRLIRNSSDRHSYASTMHRRHDLSTPHTSRRAQLDAHISGYESIR